MSKPGWSKSSHPNARTKVIANQVKVLLRSNPIPPTAVAQINF
jgi:hypothetical protein